MEDEARAQAAREEQVKAEDRERIADREKHEAVLAGIVDELKAGGYFRPGETARLVFPEPGKLGSPWKKKDGTWREGFGKAVARCETMSLGDPPADPERAKRYPKAGHFERVLAAAGYRVDVWPDYENSTADKDLVDYYIYEA